jgi:hypothetical protein
MSESFAVKKVMTSSVAGRNSRHKWRATLIYIATMGHKLRTLSLDVNTSGYECN